MTIEIKNYTGRLVRDPELRFTPNGNAVTNFTIAESDNVYDKEKQEWQTVRQLFLDVTVWDESSERKQNPTQWAHLADNLKKGDVVCVSGKLHTRTWEKDGETRYKNEVVANAFFVHPLEAFGAAPSQSQWNNQQTQQQSTTQQNNQPAPTGQNSPQANQQPNRGGFGQQPVTPQQNTQWNQPQTDEPPF